MILSDTPDQNSAQMPDSVKNISIRDFDYQLPDTKIASHPLARRDNCLLLHSNSHGRLSHHIFRSLPELLPPGALMVCNDTRVINARLNFVKDTGSHIELFLLEPYQPADYVTMFQMHDSCVWKCMVGNLKRWKNHPLEMKVRVNNDKDVVLKATRPEDCDGNTRLVRFEWDDSTVNMASIIEAAGMIPIPPYLNRKSEESDKGDYQTVYSKIMGSVAAPTAGLHFTDEVLEDLKKHDIELQRVTLHVGAGTFQPVKSELIGDHPMHSETFTVDRPLVERLINALQNHRPVVAVGTTSVRTLESLPIIGAQLMKGNESLSVGQWEAYEAETVGVDSTEALEALLRYMKDKELNNLTADTAVMIAPGFKWRIVNMMVTNFHQPQSTLLLLVSSFLDDTVKPEPQWRYVYDEAMAGDYRFLSYGDACLFERKNSLK